MIKHFRRTKKTFAVLKKSLLVLTVGNKKTHICGFNMTGIKKALKKRLQCTHTQIYKLEHTKTYSLDQYVWDGNIPYS